MRREWLALFPFMIILLSCRPSSPVPKPKGYYRIDLPDRAYQTFHEPGFPYHFEYPQYGRVEKDTLGDSESKEEDYWINVHFPEMGAKIYLSYKMVKGRDGLHHLLSDHYEMTMYHSKRADYIEDFEIQRTEANVYGGFYQVGGDAASAYQFYATDSVQHFLRGALYFDVTPNADSLAPVHEFLRKDLVHLLETLEWVDRRS